MWKIKFYLLRLYVKFKELRIPFDREVQDSLSNELHYILIEILASSKMTLEYKLPHEVTNSCIKAAVGYDILKENYPHLISIHQEYFKEIAQLSENLKKRCIFIIHQDDLHQDDLIYEYCNELHTLYLSVCEKLQITIKEEYYYLFSEDEIRYVKLIQKGILPLAS